MAAPLQHLTPDYANYCDVCQVPLGSLQLYAEHLKDLTHRQRDPHYWKWCRPCNVTLSEQRAYVEHLRTIKHCKALGNGTTALTGQRYACRYCTKSFVHDKDRRKHERRSCAESRKSGPDTGNVVPAKRSHGEDAPGERLSSVVTDLEASFMDLDEPVAESSIFVEGSINLMPTIEESDEDVMDLINEVEDSPDTTTDNDSGVDFDTSPKSCDDILSPAADPQSFDPELQPSVSVVLETVQLPARSRSVLEHAFSKRLPPPAIRQNRCHICSKPYDNDICSILAHMKSHQGQFAKYVCDECDVGFQHPGDLKFHLECAAKGYCGFNFVHAEACTGHHPPVPYQPPESLPDHDRFRLGYLLRDWEGAQLHTLMESMDILPTDEDREAYRWSQDVIKRPWSIISLPATIGSLNSMTSAKSTPTDIDYGSKRSAAAYEKRLRRLKPSAIVSRIWINRKREADLLKAKRQEATLAEAIEEGDHAAVGKLLSSGIAVNKPLTGSKYEYPHPTMTPLDLAVSFGHREVTRCLLDHGAALQRKDQGLETNFLAAVAQGELEIARCLVNCKVPVNTVDDTGASALHLAVGSGSTEMVTLLTVNGAKINAVDHEGLTPLHRAAIEGHHDIVLLLLHYGADHTLTGGSGGTALEARLNHIGLTLEEEECPLLMLLTAGEIGCAALYLENSAIYMEQMCMLIERFIRLGHVAAVHLLISHGASMGHQELRYALDVTLSEDAPQDHLGMVKALFRALNTSTMNASIQEIFADMLPRAVEKQREDVVRLLISYGADIHQQKGFVHGSALADASDNGDWKMVDALLSCGFKANTAAGFASLTRAVKANCAEIIDMFAAHGVYVDLSKQGCSPLYHAVQGGHIDSFKALLRGSLLNKQPHEPSDSPPSAVKTKERTELAMQLADVILARESFADQALPFALRLWVSHRAEWGKYNDHMIPRLLDMVNVIKSGNNE